MKWGKTMCQVSDFIDKAKAENDIAMFTISRGLAFELARLARLGEEAEKAIIECRNRIDGECPCCMDKVCDEVNGIAREGSTVSESEMVAKEVVVSKTENTTMTAEQAISLLKPQLYQDRKTVFVGKKLIPSECAEIAKVIERLQTCRECEKQSNQFFGKCENCEVMQNEPNRD